MASCSPGRIRLPRRIIGHSLIISKRLSWYRACRLQETKWLADSLLRVYQGKQGKIREKYRRSCMTWRIEVVLIDLSREMVRDLVGARTRNLIQNGLKASQYQRTEKPSPVMHFHFLTSETLPSYLKATTNQYNPQNHFSVAKTKIFRNPHNLSRLTSHKNL